MDRGLGTRVARPSGESDLALDGAEAGEADFFGGAIGELAINDGEEGAGGDGGSAAFGAAELMGGGVDAWVADGGIFVCHGQMEAAG